MFWGLFTFRVHSIREPANTFCNDEQDDLLYSGGPNRNRCWPQLAQEKLWRGCQNNADEWPGTVEISEEEIPGSRRSMHG